MFSDARIGTRARRRLIATLAVGVAVVGAGIADGAAGPAGPRLAGCRVLPADNAFNQRVDRLPAARDSAPLIARIGLAAPVHPDFGTVYAGAPNGIPITVVSDPVTHRPVHFTFASESDHARYPLPGAVAIEGGPHARGDRHVIVLDRSTCTDYELYAAYPHGGYWSAGSGAIFPLDTDRLRPAGWTSADAAGLPILPGLARYAEVASGAIDHALRFTAPCTGPHYVYPARHDAATCSGATAPPMGLRVRLKAGVNISRLPRQARIVATTLKRYGMILADNGSPWYISGAPDRRWNDAALHLLGGLTGRDFEVVDTRSLPHPGLTSHPSLYADAPVGSQNNRRSNEMTANRPGPGGLAASVSDQRGETPAARDSGRDAPGASADRGQPPHARAGRRAPADPRRSRRGPARDLVDRR